MTAALSPAFSFEAAIAERAFDVSFSLLRGETLAVLGPNGAGKSTLLNLISGLLSPDSGHAVLEGETLFSTRTSGRRIFVPPHARSIAMLAQDALLFPHLSVLQNVAFGPTSAGSGRRDALASARSWLTEVDALEFAERKPSQLSGGQAQRIAVARALAAEPRLLLLDEPLAALDIAVAPALRRMLRRVLAERTAIIVTHDVLDAFTLADRVIVIDRGRIVEDGPTRSVLKQPRDPFTAGIAGLNVLAGIRSATGLVTADGVHLRIEGGADLLPGTACTTTIRPSSIRVSTTRPDVSINTLAATVLDIEPRADLVRVRTASLAADVEPALVADLDLAAGSSVWLSFAPHDAAIYRTAR